MRTEVTGGPEPERSVEVPTPPGDGVGAPPGAAAASAPELGAGAPADTAAATRRRHAHRRPPSRLRTVLEWTAVLAVALGTALFVRTYVVQTYFIPSASMEPTLHIGDHILVLKAAYRFTSPSTGDIIVFRAPAAEHAECQDPAVQDLVKRIVATPGQTIWSVGNTIFINGHVLNQPWQHTVALGPRIHRTLVGPNQYFVMGDNRVNSCDSRNWGTVPRGNIIGKAVLIFWPLSRFGTL